MSGVKVKVTVRAVVMVRVRVRGIPLRPTFGTHPHITTLTFYVTLVSSHLSLSIHCDHSILDLLYAAV